jgi:two-component system chemotaxis response regulator CheY
MKLEDALGQRHGPFSDYIEGKAVVVADSSAAARASLVHILQSLGTDLRQITLASTFREGLDEIRRIRPQLVIADFEIGTRSGLDLAGEHREVRGQHDADRAFLVVASNTSHSAVARAAEEDVDGYIVRPYSVETVRKALTKVATEKLRPAEYALTVARGKSHLAAGRFREAEIELTRALGLNPTPTLAFFYLGQLKVARKLHDEAMNSYMSGLEFNRIHFKCNVGVYDLHMSLQRYAEAYETIKRISQVFPSNPKRFAEVLRLAIITANFQDIDPYYEVFCDLEEREEHLVRHICAALVVCGKHYLASGHRDRALKAFQRAWHSTRGKTGMLREIVQSLLEYNMRVEARAFVSKAPPETHASRDYLVSRFLVIDSEGNLGVILSAGRELISKGVADELVYSTMIRRTYQARLDAAAESITMRAIAEYPSKRDHFLEIANTSVIKK